MKMKFILTITAFLVFSFTAIAQPGKQKIKKPNNFSWGESGSGPKTNKQGNQQKYVNSQNNVNSGRNNNNMWAGDSLQPVKSPGVKGKTVKNQ